MATIIRNFSIIAHIDHGKTTLTDRMLLATHTITPREFSERMLDSNPIEQERGITIKMAPVRMEFQHGGNQVIFNIIDTPGHVDFSYEVSRSLAAVEGALLLVDATQGVQAQTLSHFHKAQEQKLTIIPVLNKVDLNNAQIENVMLEMMEMFHFSDEAFVQISAKTGQGLDNLFDAIIQNIPSPKQAVDDELQALVFSSMYHQHKGVIANVRVMSGKVNTNDPLTLTGSKQSFMVPELGIYHPQLQATHALQAGEVGYIATGLKTVGSVQVGDTLVAKGSTAAALPGYHKPQLMVFMDFYPIDGDDYPLLLDGMEKLNLHDAALEYSPTNSPALGNGLSVGFLGILHAEIVQERLAREFGLDLIATAPSVRYELEMKNGETLIITNPSELPDPSLIAQIKEPVTQTDIYTPKEYVGAIMQLSEEHRGELQSMQYLGNRTQLTYLIPLAELIVSYFDELKSVSSGYASLEYAITAYEAVDAVKLEILINHERVDALCQMIVRSRAQFRGRWMAARLKEVIPRQNFAIPIQAAVGGDIVARETISAFRKDVTAKLYGGDVTRRKKLLEKQKKGKKKRAQFGKVEIPQEAFFAVLKR